MGDATFWTAVGSLAAVIIVIGGWLGPVRGWWRRRIKRGMPRLEVNPTGGPSPDIRLVVTNRDHKSEFHATAALTASRHNSNPLRQGSYALMWLGRGTSTISLDRG